MKLTFTSVWIVSQANGFSSVCPGTGSTARADKQGWTPLLHAAANEQGSTVRVSLDRGADV